MSADLATAALLIRSGMAMLREIIARRAANQATRRAAKHAAREQRARRAVLKWRRRLKQAEDDRVRVKAKRGKE